MKWKGINSTTVEEQGILVEQVSAASAAGSVDTSVALFDGPTTQYGLIPLASWVTRTDSATLGTTITILQAGIYSCVAFMGITAAAEVTMTISIDATVAQRQGTSILNDVQIRAASFAISTGVQSLAASCNIPVTGAMIGAGQNVIRLLYFVTTTGAAVPAGSFANENDVLIKIHRIGDVNG